MGLCFRVVSLANVSLVVYVSACMYPTPLPCNRVVIYTFEPLNPVDQISSPPHSFLSPRWNTKVLGGLFRRNVLPPTGIRSLQCFPLEPILWQRHWLYFIMITPSFPFPDLWGQLYWIFTLWTCWDSCRESPHVGVPLRLWSPGISHPLLATLSLMQFLRVAK